MRKLILIALMAVMVSNVHANDLNALLIDTVLAADTAADGHWRCSSYTPTMPVFGAQQLQFYSKITAPVQYTEWGSSYDSFKVYCQVSADQKEWKTYKIDSATASDSGFADLVVSAFDSIGGNRWIGNYARGLFVHVDTCRTYAPDSLANIRAAQCELWIVTK